MNTNEVQQTHNKLLSNIKKHLRRGDQKAVAQELNVTTATVCGVLKNRTKNNEVLEALHKKAKQNKQALLKKYKAMINELKNN